MACTVAAVMGTGKGRKPKLTDFMPRWSRRRRQSAGAQLAVLRGLAARQEGLKRVDHR